MPDNVGVDDRFSLNYYGRLFGQRIIMTHHFRIDTQLDDPTYVSWVQMAAEAFGSQFELAGFMSGLLTLQTTQMQWEYLRVQRITPIREIYWQQNLTAAGALAEEAETANLACSVERRTARPGRHGVGRLQLCGFPVTSMAEGQWSAIFRGSLESALFDMTENVAIGTAGTEVRFVLFDPLAPTDPDSDILQVLPQSTVRVMHRRTVGLGE